MQNSKLQLLYSKQEIEKTVSQISQKIIDYSTYSKTQEIVFIGVLNGSFMFFSDLVKQVLFPCEIDFIKIKSYNGKQQQEVKILSDININIKDKTVFLVDDIIDSGNTYIALKNHLNNLFPYEIIPVSLFKRGTVNIDNIIYGFEVQNEFLVGYGFDDENGKSRNMPFILGQDWNID